MQEEQNIFETLKNIQQKITHIKPRINIEVHRQEVQKLEQATNNPDLWQNPENAQQVTQKLSQKQKYIQKWAYLFTEPQELIDLLSISETAEEISDIRKNLAVLEEKFKAAEIELLFSGKYDQSSAILSIHVGNGGDDAEDFCQMLMRMYLRYAEIKNFSAKILDESRSEVGLKSATLEISGTYAYGFLRSEHGVHRLIRQSPFNAKGLRQTSFAKIEILPLIATQENLAINPQDLRVDVFRSSGAGGQSVNTTDSAVRITYLPLNLSVTCQNERSQQQNKANALKVLHSRLLQLQIEQQAEKLDQLRGEKLDANFGSQIRTYTLHPYKLVKDHRTNYEESNVEKILDGHLEKFSEVFLKNQ
jgi:peptide chain release factor 2